MHYTAQSYPQRTLQSRKVYINIENNVACFAPPLRSPRLWISALYLPLNLSPVSDRYNQRGVSASKEDVHQAIAKLDKGLFPKAFCKIVPDYLGNDNAYCIVMHA